LGAAVAGGDFLGALEVAGPAMVVVNYKNKKRHDKASI
jgi:hypothetical protein